jgi:isoquinoline 1-oxidoreductase beta subunit
VGRLAIDRDRYRRVLQLAADKAGWGQPLPSRPGRRAGRGLAGNVYDGNTYVAYVAEVSVGSEGDVQVHRMVAAVDCGRAVNPLGVEAQVEGGIAFGLSAALGGEITFRDGQVEQSSYADYPLLRLSGMPDVETHIVPSDERPSGMGEPPVPTAAPAVMNAVFAATRHRVRRLPLRAENQQGDG